VAAMVLHRRHIVRMVDVMVGMALCYATMLSMGLRPFASGPTMSRAARQQQQQQEEEEQQQQPEPGVDPTPLGSRRAIIAAEADWSRSCDSGDTGGRRITVDDVVFGVLTSSRFVPTRVAAMQATWLKNARHVVFYSEADIASLPAVGLKPPPGEELVGGGAWKNFPALVDLYKKYPEKSWTFFTDDDTYVFVDNLLRALELHRPDRDVYLGLYYTPRVDMEWHEVHIAYASGGAGYAISRSLMRRLAPAMPRCHRTYTRWAGDLRVGKCVHDLGVRVTNQKGFHHEGHELCAAAPLSNAPTAR